ncbi:MAG: ATP-binding cassette domain-containing protein [Kiritimatiellae bacterium]|nr:ATP-binding cassette domain-containing protein [Kiritimatiellia bacterium]
MSDQRFVLRARDLVKAFPTADGEVRAVDGVSLDVPRGAVYGVIGFSGAGKSTLVRCFNLLETPTSGTVEVEGRDLTAMSRGELKLARRRIGMIFQSFNLLMQRTALGNVLFPLEIAGVPRAEARERALEALAGVGLADRANAWPAQLSGGQKQRVAIARCLVSGPSLLLCDEATSALDPHTTASVLHLLRDLNRSRGLTLVVITHSMSVVREICTHVAVMEAGRIAERGSVAEVLGAPRSEAARRLVTLDGIPRADLLAAARRADAAAERSPAP